MRRRGRVEVRRRGRGRLGGRGRVEVRRVEVRGRL